MSEIAYALIVEGSLIQLEYEEMVNLLVRCRNKGSGDEYDRRLSVKIQEAWRHVTPTSY